MIEEIRRKIVVKSVGPLVLAHSAQAMRAGACERGERLLHVGLGEDRGTACHAFLAAERQNWPGWLAVMLGLGIAGYFALALRAADSGLGAAGTVILVAVFVLLRRRALVCRGTVRVARRQRRLHGGTNGGRAIVAAPASFQDTLRFRPCCRAVSRRSSLFPTGIRADARSDRHRRTAARPDAGADPAEDRQGALKAADDRRSASTSWRGLQPPSPPAAPGAFDFRRQAYFQRLGATGFALGPATPFWLLRTIRRFGSEIWTWIDRLRGDHRKAASRCWKPGAPPGAMARAPSPSATRRHWAARRYRRDADLRPRGHLPVDPSGLHIGMGSPGLFLLRSGAGCWRSCRRWRCVIRSRKWSGRRGDPRRRILFAAGRRDGGRPSGSFFMIAIVFLGVAARPFAVLVSGWSRGRRSSCCSCSRRASPAPASRCRSSPCSA